MQPSRKPEIAEISASATPKVMTQREARDYVRRWRQVELAEAEELRTTSVTIKFRQLSALMASASMFDWSDVQEEDALIRERWARLRHAVGV